MIVTPVSIVQHYIPCSPNPEMSLDVCFSLESNEGKVDPERDELESPSAGTGFETPGQQCHPIWETGRTAADGFLTAGVGSNLGKHTSPTTKRVDTRAVRTTTTSSNSLNITFLQQGHETKDRRKAAKKTNSSMWGRRRAATALEHGCNGSLFFSWRERWAWSAGCFCFVFFVFVCLPVSSLLYLFTLSGDHLFNKLRSMRGDADQVADVRNRRASIFLPINPLKMAKINNTRFGRIENALG